MSENIEIFRRMKVRGYGEKQIYIVLLLLEDLRHLWVENIDRFQKALF